jgi:O-antigen biosynthesis protein
VWQDRALDDLESCAGHALSQALQQLRSALDGELRPRAEVADAIAAVERAIVDLESAHGQTGRVLHHILANQRRLENRLLTVEQSILFRIFRAVGTPLLRWKRAVTRQPNPEALYRAWLLTQPEENLPAETGQAAESLGYRPAISILLPLGPIEQPALERAIESVLRQSYTFWQLLVLAAREDEPSLRVIPERFHSESRVRVRLAPAGRTFSGISELVSGEYVMIMGPRDALAPSALHDLVGALQHETADAVYSDEDSLTAGGRRERPIFKPGWSPELLACRSYPGRPLLVSRAALDRIGWFRDEFCPMEEYDAALRLAEVAARVRHVPRVLYHRGAGECEGASEAGRRALAAAIARRKWSATIEDGPSPDSYRLKRTLTRNPLASIIICSKNPRLLRRCLRSLDERTAYEPREVVVVEHEMGQKARMDAAVGGSQYLRVPFEGPFNFSRMNNLGARAARGEVLVLLNDDTEPLDAAWLERLVAEACRPEIGVVGARLLYPSGRIQHAGIAMGIMDGAGHPGCGELRPPFWRWVELTRNVTAVTGACMAFRRSVFDELGGLDPLFPANYNDVDFCLRARRAHYEVVCHADAVLRHYDARTRTAVVRSREREAFWRRWGSVLEDPDPFYNQNLARDRNDASLRLEDGGFAE